MSAIETAAATWYESPLAGVVVGAVTTGAFAIVQHFLNMRAQDQRDKAARNYERVENRYEERRQNYSKFLSAVRSSLSNAQKFEEENHVAPGEYLWADGTRLEAPEPDLEHALATLRLLAPDETYDAATELVRSFYRSAYGRAPGDGEVQVQTTAQVIAAETKFVKAAQADLGLR